MSETKARLETCEIPALADCPFCGGKAVVVSHPGYNWDGMQEKHVNIGAMHGLWYVGCPYIFFEGSAPHCEIHPAACWYASLEEAIKWWNRRVGPADKPNDAWEQCNGKREDLSLKE